MIRKATHPDRPGIAEVRLAARASSRVESSVGRGALPSFMINGISVQPRMTASQPRAFMPSITRW